MGSERRKTSTRALLLLLIIGLPVGGCALIWRGCESRPDMPALRKDGRKLVWRKVFPAKRAPNFSGVWGRAPDDIWAIGDGVVQFDGKGWTDHTALFRKYLPLGAVGGLSQRRHYFIGKMGTLLRLENGRLAVVKTPVSVYTLFVGKPETFVLTGIDAQKRQVILYGRPGAWERFLPDQRLLLEPPVGTSGTDVWVVGASYGYGNAAYHFDGKRWRTEHVTRWFGTAFASWVDEKGRIVVHISWIDHYLKRRVGPSWLGVRWEILEAEGMERVRFYSTCSAGAAGLWALGYVESKALIYHLDGRQWRAYESEVALNGARIWADPSGLLVLLGGDNAIYTRSP